MRPFFLLPAFVPLSVLSAPVGEVSDARFLVESQVKTAAAAILVLEQEQLPPARRAALLQPLAEQLESLQNERARMDAAQLEAEEARAAANAGVQQIALRLLRDMERLAATDCEGSLELKAALERLVLAFEGEKKTAARQPEG